MSVQRPSHFAIYLMKRKKKSYIANYFFKLSNFGPWLSHLNPQNQHYDTLWLFTHRLYTSLFKMFTYLFTQLPLMSTAHTVSAWPQHCRILLPPCSILLPTARSAHWKGCCCWLNFCWSIILAAGCYSCENVECSLLTSSESPSSILLWEYKVFLVFISVILSSSSSFH